MKSLKLFGAVAALTLLAQPAYAQQSDMDQSKMDHSKMDHGQMNHDDHDHNHPEMDDAAAAADIISEGTPTIVAKVNGLVCDFCAQALKKVFKKEDAVESLNVDLDAGEVRIGLKTGQTLSNERVAELIRKSGYSLVETKREGGA